MAPWLAAVVALDGRLAALRLVAAWLAAWPPGWQTSPPGGWPSASWPQYCLAARLECWLDSGSTGGLAH